MAAREEQHMHHAEHASEHGGELGHGEEQERFWSELDWDDIAESFLGSLAAALVVAMVLALAMRGGQFRDNSRIRRFVARR